MDKDLKLWKRRARSHQQNYFDCLGDRLYDKVNDEQLAFKVGYALYGFPSTINEENKTAVYTENQQNHIKLICDKIKSLQPSNGNMFYISYLHVVIRLKNKKKDEGLQVLFRVPKCKDGKLNILSHVFIDPKPRQYNTWDDYLQKNKLPKCDMCWPANGIYSTTDGILDISFTLSPACDKSTAIFTGLDVSSALLLVGATGVTLASLAVPIAMPVVWGAAASVVTCGTYDTARNVYKLHDIKTHGESLGFKNADSRSAWLSLAGSVVCMASTGATVLAKGAVVTESAISRTGLMTLRVLNASSFAVGVINEIITLVIKHINGTLETRDILHFTFACLYFLNTVVSYDLGKRLVGELAFSDLTNLFNVRKNASYKMIKEITELCGSQTYYTLRQLVIGKETILSPNKIHLESIVMIVVELLGSISGKQFFDEMSQILQQIWKSYENDIMEASDELIHTFENQYWKKIIPNQTITNLEVPLQMCEEIDRLLKFCGINSNSNAHKDLVIFAQAFSTVNGVSTYQEFIKRFKFYCYCVINQFKEEKENYENELDSQSSKPNFDRACFNQFYGIQGNINDFFFDNALNKVNHPDFLGNIDELYNKLSKTEEPNNNLPYFQTARSSIYLFCGPLHQRELTNDYYWEIAANLTGFKVDCTNASIRRNDNLIVIQPKCELGIEETNNSVARLDSIVIQSPFINDCHMGSLVVIFEN